MAKYTIFTREIEESLKDSEFENSTIRSIGHGSFELWLGSSYLCMLTKVGNQWGATHNMYPNERTKMHDTPLKSVRYYRDLQ